MIVYHRTFGEIDVYIHEESQQGLAISRDYRILAAGSSDGLFPSVIPGFEKYEIDEQKFRDLMDAGKKSVELNREFYEKLTAFTTSLKPLVSK